jgi:PAS domain S-box-containing protein
MQGNHLFEPLPRPESAVFLAYSPVFCPKKKSRETMSEDANKRLGSAPKSTSMRQVEGREWWLWGFAVIVTLVLTFGILSLTFPGFHLTGGFYLLNLKEWVRGLAALVLLFDIYTVYQRWQLQCIRRRLAERDELFQLITENAADMIAVVDGQGKRIYNSPAYERVLGYSPKDLAGTPAIQQVHPEDHERVIAAAEKARATGRGERLEYRIRHKDGSWRVLESTSSALPAEDGSANRLVIVNRDITERKKVEALLAYRAFHDGLTNLPNRALLLDRLQRAIAVSRRHSDFKFAVLFIDIDEFKVVNDSLGHAAGDDLLVQIALRLSISLRGADTIARSPARADADNLSSDSTLARPGGDEFVVLVEELHDASDAIRISERIRERLALPFNVSGHQIVVTASIGIAFRVGAAAEAQDVLRDAEIAMYRAKHAGKSRFEVFDGAMHAGAVKRLQLESDLRKALETDELRVHYQPLVALSTGRIVGFEALSRWQRPERMVMPAEFIPVADETGLILPINRKLIREACQQVRDWNVRFPGKDSFSVNVNITDKQFSDPELASFIGEILKETGLDPALLDLEITENIAMSDAERSGVVLRELKALGVRLSIDDFGTGYSSLCRLRQFPVDTLKIDRTFVSKMERNRETQEIVRIIITLAHNLGLSVVAEGIEEQTQLEMLKALGSEIGQGYLFSKPVGRNAIEQLIRETNGIFKPVATQFGDPAARS